MSSAGVGPLCFLKTNVTAPVYQEILEHFMVPSADQLFKDADFIFQQDLAPAHTAKSTKSWLNDHVLCAWLASKFTRPEPQRESLINKIVCVCVCVCVCVFSLTKALQISHIY